MIYLKYKLEQANVSCLKRVLIEKSKQEWVYDHIRAEILALYPEADVIEANLGADKGLFDLVVLPFQGVPHSDPRALLQRLKNASRLTRQYILIYGFAQRRLEVVPANKWRSWYRQKVWLKLATHGLGYFKTRGMLRSD